MHPRFAWRPTGAIALTLLAILIGTATRYGYHRDELYFIVAGRHPAWGYDDQPAFTPLLAALLDHLAPDNLTVLRLPSAICAATMVILAAAIAYEMGADRTAQLLASAVMATGTLTIYTGHLLSTATFDMFYASVLIWLLARWNRTRQDRLLLAAGAVAGLALNNKLLIIIPLAIFIACLPRLWTRPLFWAGVAIALTAWAPYLIWQTQHGWPQLDMANVVTAREPGGGRYLMLPMQFLLFGPITAPIWLAGLWRLLRNPNARAWRGFGIAYLLLLAVFLTTGGQFYYPSSGYPALIAAGAIATVSWTRHGRRQLRTAVTATAVALTAAGSIAMGLPIYPVACYHSSPQAAVNPDSAETIGWPGFVRTIADVYHKLPDPAHTAILTGNYGEAGAIDHYGPTHGLPTPYSGHNAYWRWGPPPETATTVLIVGGFTEDALRSWCGSLSLATRHNNRLDVDNEEQGVPIWICRDLKENWQQLWPRQRHLS